MQLNFDPFRRPQPLPKKNSPPFPISTSSHSQARLSERNVVELVSKLNELGFLPKEELLHSSNGREFLTRARLRQEVREAVTDAARGGSGRIPLVELQALLGVDLVHCERAAREAVAEDEEREENRSSAERKKERSLQIINDSELVSASYFDAVVGEVDELLSGGSGAVSLADLCSRFALGASVLTRVLEGATTAGAGSSKGSEAPPPLLRARLDGGFLVTAAAAARARATLRGALRGLTVPAQLSALAKNLGIDPRVLAGVGGGSGGGGGGGGNGGGGGLASAVEAMLRSGEVRGALRGGGASFAPEVHSRAVAAASAAFYAQNGYVEVSSSGYSSAATASLPEGAVLLPSGAVAASPALVAQVEAAVEDAAASVSSASSSPPWIDISSLGVIPPAFSKGDARALLARAPAAEKLLLATKSASAAGAAAAAAVAATTPAPDNSESGSGSSSVTPPPPPLLLAGTCVVSGAMLHSLRKRARELALAEAAEVVVSEGKAASTSASAASEVSEEAPRIASATAANASKSSKVDKNSDDDDDWSMGGKSKKKGGAASKKSKGGGGGGGGVGASRASRNSTYSTPPPAAALSLSELAAAIERWHPGTADAGIGDGGDESEDDQDDDDKEEDEKSPPSSSLARALASLLRPAALAAFDAAVADAASSGAASRKRAREALLAAAADASDRLQLYARGVEALVGGGKAAAAGGGGGGGSGDGSTNATDATSAAAAEAISRHLILRGPGAEAADALLRVLAFDAAADEGGGAGGESPFAKLPPLTESALSPAERAVLVASLPKNASSSSPSSREEAAALVEALSSSDIPALVGALEAATAAAGSRFRGLERRAEKRLAAAARLSLEGALRRETNPAAALLLAASVALARLRPGRAVPPVPGRALGFLLGALAATAAAGEDEGDADAASSTVALFKRFHGLVVARLKSSSGGGGGAGRGDKGSSNELEALLPRLKRAALGEGEGKGGGED